ncbi:MAG: hypothetical protein JSS27_10050 [Planctomycetes bacterium]|nr:hypothetical protein [Planctomycetota bacterium]
MNLFSTIRSIIVVTCVTLLLASSALAGVSSKAVQEVAELVFRRGGKEATEMGLETITRKVELLAARYGDEGLRAARRVGPRTFHIVEQAGDQGRQAVRLLARYGDDAAWVAAKGNRLAIASRLGDDAAEAMIRHGEVAEPLLNALGEPAAKALKEVSSQNGRRLAMLAEDGTLGQWGHTDQLLGVIGRYGDRAMDFIWKNKAGLAVGTALVAFLANPEPFIDGTVQLGGKVTENVAQPVAHEMAKSTNWTTVLPAFAVVLAAVAAFRMWLHKPRAA